MSLLKLVVEMTDGRTAAPDALPHHSTPTVQPPQLCTAAAALPLLVVDDCDSSQSPMTDEA